MGRVIPMVVVLFVAFFALATVVVAQDDETPSVTAEDQEVTGNSVVVASVVYTDVGWIVIHTDVDNRPGPVIGQTAIEAGENTDVEVELTEPVTDGQALWAMLHVDAGEEGTYEFPGADVPVFLDGDIVMQQFTVTVGTGVEDTAETGTVTETETTGTEDVAATPVVTETEATPPEDVAATPVVTETTAPEDVAATPVVTETTPPEDATPVPPVPTPAVMAPTGGDGRSWLPLGMVMLGIGLLVVAVAMLRRPRLRVRR